VYCLGGSCRRERRNVKGTKRLRSRAQLAAVRRSPPPRRVILVLLPPGAAWWGAASLPDAERRPCFTQRIEALLVLVCETGAVCYFPSVQGVKQRGHFKPAPLFHGKEQVHEQPQDFFPLLLC
jgi:hypothetical protein